MKNKRKRRKELVRGGLSQSGALKPVAPVSGNGSGRPGINHRDVSVPLGVDDEGEETPWFRIGPLMGTIIVLAISWICFVAWMIYDGKIIAR